jgi:demethylmenaquinone methyltransferase/2-methoxy-6-polyprenyl-1,4-benzoquinol methylase
MADTASKPLVWDESRLVDPHGQPDKAARVQAMFDAIAPTYEKVNRWLSLGRDTIWRRRAVELAAVMSTDRVIDLACGTGDFARAFSAAHPGGVVGCDFSSGMLRRAQSRTSSGGARRIQWYQADALHLPFANESFNIASCAFGVRNLQDLSQGFSEAYRVLRPGGRFVILEFSTPRAPLLGRLYMFYLSRVLPLLATLISRDQTGAYQYLPASVSTFVDAEGIAKRLTSAGFAHVEHHRLTLGVVTIHLAWKS